MRPCVRILKLTLLVGLAIGAAQADDQQACPGMVYLGNARSSALFVDVPTAQAVYSRETDDAASLLEAMRQFRQQRNVKPCGERCVNIELEEGRIVLAFKSGPVGYTYHAADMSFRVQDLVKNFGFSLGDLYWIEYRGGDANNPAGVFLYSSNNGVLSISMANDAKADNAAVGATLTLVQTHGLLSDACALR
jgi:hypothetical protein